MSRIKRGILHSKRRRNILKLTKGFRWGRKSKLKLAKVAKMKAGQHAYNSRRIKKREFRANWQINISAAVREFGMNYSEFIGKLKKKGIDLNRKMMADIAKENHELFVKIVEEVK